VILEDGVRITRAILQDHEKRTREGPELFLSVTEG
jgi:hypothetical protein